MSLAINWLDELDEDELEVDRVDDAALTDETEPAEQVESVEDGLDGLDVEHEPEDILDEGGFDVVMQYFQESARHQLLSVADERELARAVERGRIAEKKLARTRRSLSDTSRRQLHREVSQALTAREELIRSNARLVISIAKRYQNLGLPLMDLIQEGNIGLLRAIDRFEPSRGLRLSTYATWWVRQRINRAVANQGRTIRLPAYLQDRLHQLYRVSQALEQSLGRVPNDTELAETLEVTPTDIRSLQTLAMPVVSVDDSLSEKDDESALEQIEDTQVTPVDDLVGQQLLCESIARALEELPARCALIVRMRYGLDGDQPHTLEAIARKLRLSRERVRQIERDAFTRLRLSADVRKQRQPLAV
ncbi:MAG TPA: sigma-70 family RNA polymerase sigma factor [Anaerolineae bacterium]|nr:sigma-70 family RNA polymerase sigma factor [Anaerolineae bacterium]